MLPIDPSLSFPNVNGVPLALVPAAADDDVHASLVELHSRMRAAQSLAEYAGYTLDVEPALHHRLICSHIDDLLADRFDELIINSPPGSAKALDLDTPIPTPDGWKRMGDLKVGDTVFDENGVPCAVTWVSPVHRNRPVYSVTTDCGDTIVADRDHEWLVRLCGKQKRSLKGVDRWGNVRPTTRSREPSFKIKETHQLHGKRSKRPMIRRAAALDLPAADLPIDPYLLGVWLGDGTSATPSITSSDEDRPWLRAELERLGYETTDRKATYLFGIKGVRHLFASLGLLNDPVHATRGRKHIPQQYLRASREQRLALLQGLIDTDGTVCRKRGCTTFCNTNLELSLQVRELVRTLGVKAGWSESPAMLNGVRHGTAYKVSFYLQDSARLPRKAVLTRNQYRTPDTYIDVVPLGTADTVCIEVDSPSHLFLCGRSMTPTHNSTYTSHALGAYFLGAFPDRNVICATHTAELSERWSRKVRNTIGSAEHQQVFPASALSKDSTAVSRWATSAGGEFLAAGVGGSILGFRADLGILDDPIAGFEQAQSITQLVKVQGWYETDFVTRLKPGAKVVLICQRLSPNDLAGYLIQRNALNPTRRQRVLILRMEATDDDPLGRAPGERLWPEWYTQEMVEDARRDDFKWRTLYQQEPPSDTGSWVAPSEVQFRPSPANPEVLYGVTDLALSVNTGDYTVHFIVAVDHNGDWDIIEASRKRVDVAASAATLVGFCQTHGSRIREWLIDDDNASKVFMHLVATEARQQKTFVPWKPLPMRGQDKETRAAPLRGMFKRKKIFMPADAPFARWLLEEIAAFPNALGQGVDDGIDALSLLGRRLAAIAPAPSTVVALPPKPKTWQDVTLDEMWSDRELNLGRRKRIG